MNMFKVGFAGALMLVFGSTTAIAGDMWDRGGSLKDSGYVDVRQSGWYLRGDVGFDVGLDGTVSDTIVAAGLAPAFINTDFDEGWSIGGGIGYNLMRGIRVDATLDYRMGADVFSQVPPGLLAINDFTGELDSLVGLVNIYYDFDMGHRITPYVGVGVGFARHTLEGDDTDDSDTDVAWAIMAGVDIDIRSGWKLDVGYRYIDMGEARFDDRKNGIPLKDFLLEDLESHEIRVGLRYQLGCLRHCGVDYTSMK